MKAEELQAEFVEVYFAAYIDASLDLVSDEIEFVNATHSGQHRKPHPCRF